MTFRKLIVAVTSRFKGTLFVSERSCQKLSERFIQSEAGRVGAPLLLLQVVNQVKADSRAERGPRAVAGWLACSLGGLVCVRVIVCEVRDHVYAMCTRGVRHVYS